LDVLAAFVFVADMRVTVIVNVVNNESPDSVINVFPSSHARVPRDFEKKLKAYFWTFSAKTFERSREGFWMCCLMVFFIDDLNLSY